MSVFLVKIIDFNKCEEVSHQET